MFVPARGKPHVESCRYSKIQDPWVYCFLSIFDFCLFVRLQFAAFMEALCAVRGSCLSVAAGRFAHCSQRPVFILTLPLARHARSPFGSWSAFGVWVCECLWRMLFRWFIRYIWWISFVEDLHGWTLVFTCCGQWPSNCRDWRRRHCD